MSDLISRSKLIEDIKRRKYIDKPLEEIFETIIDEQPAVEPKRVEWLKTFRCMLENINTGKLEPVYNYDCPICKYHTGNQGRNFNFCPNCGSQLKKEV